MQIVQVICRGIGKKIIVFLLLCCVLIETKLNYCDGWISEWNQPRCLRSCKLIQIRYLTLSTPSILYTTILSRNSQGTFVVFDLFVFVSFLLIVVFCVLPISVRRLWGFTKFARAVENLFSFGVLTAGSMFKLCCQQSVGGWGVLWHSLASVLHSVAFWVQSLLNTVLGRHRYQHVPALLLLYTRAIPKVLFLDLKKVFLLFLCIIFLMLNACLRACERPLGDPVWLTGL